jgi:prepilin-type processing-associated H-X9-DG protein
MRQAEITQPATTVIVVEGAAPHRKGMNVLFADGHVQYVAVAAGQHWRGALTGQGWTVPDAPARE